MGSCLCTPAKAGVHHIIKPLPQNSVHDSSPRKSSVAVVPHHRSIIWVLDKTAGDDIFGKYLFGKELGRGEFGITYRCVHRETGEAFASKTISKSKLKTEIDVEDVRREAEIMRRLPKHLNIVCFKEAYEDREAVYLVMELCEGGELFDRIVAKGHYTERAAANVTRTMLEVCQVVADNLPGDQIDGIRQIFEMMDIDNNGNLTFEELRDGLVKIGHNVADPDVHMLLDAADADGNGTLSCEEFVMVSVHLKTIDSDGFLHQAFGYFDKNNSGYIEFKELREALLDDTLGPANEQVIQDIIFDVDLDKDGRISFGEFKGNDENWHGLQNGFSSIFEGIAKCTDRKLLKDESLQANYNGK